jgi:glycosyltransferase involved in cell wall biosynthesis
MKILIFHHYPQISGGMVSLVQLVRCLKGICSAPVIVLPAHSELEEILQREDVAIVIEPKIQALCTNTDVRSIFNIRTVLGIIFIRRSQKAIRTLCEKYQPDVVYLNSSALVHLASGAKRAGVPNVVLHLREHWSMHPWDIRNIIKNRVCRSAIDKIISISEQGSQQFGFNEKTEIVPNWVEIGQGERPSFAGYEPNFRILLTMGGRSAIKGALTAILAMDYIKEDDVKLVVLGGHMDFSPAWKVLRLFLGFFKINTYGMWLDKEALKRGRRVELIPASRNVHAWLNRARVVLVLNSVPHFPRPVIEAGMFSKAVVACEDVYTRDLIESGSSGLLVPANDARMCAEAVEELLKDPEEAERMGRALNKSVLTNFSKEVSCQKIRRIIMQLDVKRSNRQSL